MRDVDECHHQRYGDMNNKHYTDDSLDFVFAVRRQFHERNARCIEKTSPLARLSLFAAGDALVVALHTEKNKKVLNGQESAGTPYSCHSCD
ncbi:hypothetical protein KIN20_032465 [Parelaphostrongylus tenuis]|uniref:Uncharacterized protein n=1 Tax=Parelaphostrongylus tenuis TaxID=148309 RepID=A0AAD5R8U6_PARTN|nr:hypothetical protein KIN20_032465 [Parelaphostrongylus tenuis]